jgi:DNA-binding NtrC family response regulator
MKASVLLVDDDAALRRALADRLAHWGHDVVQAGSGAEAIEAARRREFDLVLLDLSMPGIDGREVLRVLREEGCPSDVVVLTAHGSVEAAVEALKGGAADFLVKPADFEVLRRVVNRSVEARGRRRANEALEGRLQDGRGALVARSAAMARLLETAQRAAASDAVVLVTGESGTGKQVLAEHVHRSSPRRDAPFVYVNCVALSDDLVESTLFGHEKGAFTGAVARKEGRLETAAGGTAFLDEIGDTTARCQTKLLHFLETGAYERVGGTRTLSVDCRVVAATNRDLPAAIRDGRFREDLWYRLNVVRLHVPPLRERREDVRPLAEHFADRFSRETKRPRPEISARALEVMEAYPWPGNVRQLKNALERMVVLAPGDVLTPDLLPPEVLAPAAAGGSVLDRADLPWKPALREMKRAYLASALLRHGGNQTKAAEALGLQRTFLNRLLKSLDVVPRPAPPPDGGEASPRA